MLSPAPTIGSQRPARNSSRSGTGRRSRMDWATVTNPSCPSGSQLAWRERSVSPRPPSETPGRHPRSPPPTQSRPVADEPTAPLRPKPPALETSKIKRDRPHASGISEPVVTGFGRCPGWGRPGPSQSRTGRSTLASGGEGSDVRGLLRRRPAPSPGEPDHGRRAGRRRAGRQARGGLPATRGGPACAGPAPRLDARRPSQLSGPTLQLVSAPKRDAGTSLNTRSGAGRGQLE